MKTYLVGGALRDELLGLPVNDRDYVVVGATVEQMLERGFKPVGKDFPVFLHPKTHEEYALARTERKVAAGYQGFHFYTDPSVTIEEDLQRRDLTINAIARCDDGDDGGDVVMVDPYGGQVDLKNRVFRHVSEAFAEDPVRILRIARFSARFAQAPIDFSIAPETMSLMRQMVDEGEVDALVPERVWQEIATGLMENTPSRMFEVLRECGALQRLMPELHALWGVPQPPLHHPEIDTGVHIMLVVDYAAAQKQSLAIRFAALMHDLGKGVTPKEMWPRHHGHEERGIALVEKLCARLKVPSECRDLAIMTAREHGKVGRAFEMRAATLVELFEKNDAIRRPERFHDMLQAAKADCFGRAGLPNIEFPQVEFLTECLAAARAVNAGEIAQGFLGEPKKINEAVRAARVKAVAQHPLVQSKLQN